MKTYSLVVMLLLLFAIFPAVNESPSNTSRPVPDFSLSEAKMLEDVPYVWQEINGFCNWAGTTILMQYAGVDISMHNLFVLSGVGFAFAYIRFNDTMLLFPGVIYQQVDPVAFAAQLFGLNYTLYLGTNLEGIESQIDPLRQRGINVGLIHNENEAFGLMRRTIDAGYPLLISVDPLWLPASDYDFLRDQGLSGGAHGVVIVGYNDTAGVAYIQDPGVGSFGNLFGYPSDGRGNYTQISYANLNLAWSNRYYISITLIPELEPVPDISSLLGPRIRDLLLGIGETYAPGSASAYIWQFGERAFRGLSTDLTVDGLESYLSVFDGIENEVSFKASLLQFIGIGVESQVTLQYLSYRTALKSLPRFLPDVDLTDFMNAANSALSHFEALSDNSTLIWPGNLSALTGFVYETFHNIAESYNSTGDLHSSLSRYAVELETISNHLLEIADSWLAAGEALESYWPRSPLIVYGPIIAVVLGISIAAVAIAVFIIRRTPSQ